jgi:hypothetical protein
VITVYLNHSVTQASPFCKYNPVLFFLALECPARSQISQTNNGYTVLRRRRFPGADVLDYRGRTSIPPRFYLRFDLECDESYVRQRRVLARLKDGEGYIPDL